MRLLRAIIATIFLIGIGLAATAFSQTSGHEGIFRMESQPARVIQSSLPQMELCPDREGRFKTQCVAGTITWRAPEGFSRLSLINLTGREPRLISRPDTIYSAPRGCVKEIQVAMGMPVPSTPGGPSNRGPQDIQANLLRRDRQMVIYRHPYKTGLLLHVFKRISDSKWLELHISQLKVSRKSAVADIAAPFMVQTDKLVKSQRYLMRQPSPGPCRQPSLEATEGQLLGIADSISYRAS